ncbi:sulfatase family protein [Hoeflea prorocentri]|uniref:Sulfatase-like hydrolase/transferase n=1 Tax=Hoeflea prorocentri TaxID=1922333 RepID=A0A9X3UFQ5_9HYPH|nr:sulfatase-like hydrolase/transferase [Hoeflea prorocentri]MCY6379764.1 sulfatase-like hydrolase/transferase [Hoeflea prorocentri]MDA5397564.1 sulfatase-like hydrolase/transferase [Hoeflea prorocentri]
MNQRPNFIVFMTDQQRADHLACYGNPIVQTPNIDSFAQRGTRFENFYVANPICQPNRAALATGQLTSVNGCRQNGIPLSLDSTTYADVLRSAGYRTGLVGKAHFQNVSPVAAKPPVLRGDGSAPPEPFHLSRRRQRRGPEYEWEIRSLWAETPDREVPLPYYGFDHLRMCIGHGDQVEGHYTKWLKDRLGEATDPRGRANAIDDGLKDAPQIWRTSVPEELYPTSYVGEEACAFLEAEDDRPFLLVVSFPDPHHPFTPPGRYFDLYDPADIELPESFDHPTWARNDLPEHIKRVYEIGAEKPDAYWPFHSDADSIRRMTALNYGAITMIDDWIGKITDALGATGRSQETIIVFMSDHGDYMGDHGTVLKHGLHTNGLIRVPLVWYDPTNPTAGVSAVQGNAIDFAPTLLQRAGLQCPAGMQGRDLLAADAEDLPVLIEDSGLAFASADGRTATRTLIHDGWRMSVFEGSDLGELYDLQVDPHEVRNLWSDPTAAEHKAAMLHLMIDRQIGLRDTSLIPTHQA